MNWMNRQWQGSAGYLCAYISIRFMKIGQIHIFPCSNQPQTKLRVPCSLHHPCRWNGHDNRNKTTPTSTPTLKCWLAQCWSWNDGWMNGGMDGGMGNGSPVWVPSHFNWIQIDIQRSYFGWLLGVIDSGQKMSLEPQIAGGREGEGGREVEIDRERAISIDP